MNQNQWPLSTLTFVEPWALLTTSGGSPCSFSWAPDARLLSLLPQLCQPQLCRLLPPLFPLCVPSLLSFFSPLAFLRETLFTLSTLMFTFSQLTFMAA